jgi:metal transporter CNNM
MGQDDVYLRVIATSGEGDKQERNAQKVHKLISGRKHWVLVTLLLGNVSRPGGLRFFIWTGFKSWVGSKKFWRK